MNIGFHNPSGSTDLQRSRPDPKAKMVAATSSYLRQSQLEISKTKINIIHIQDQQKLYELQLRSFVDSEFTPCLFAQQPGILKSEAVNQFFCQITALLVTSALLLVKGSY